MSQTIPVATDSSSSTRLKSSVSAVISRMITATTSTGSTAYAARSSGGSLMACAPLSSCATRREEPAVDGAPEADRCCEPAERNRDFFRPTEYLVDTNLQHGGDEHERQQEVRYPHVRGAGRHLAFRGARPLWREHPFVVCRDQQDRHGQNGQQRDQWLKLV